MDGNRPFFLKEGIIVEYIKAKKKYGQNFLKTQEILEKIAGSIAVEKDDLVIEIGPGMGALTEYLYKKDSYLLCYEIDPRMESYLEKYNTEKSQVIFDDFLKRDIKEDSKKYPFQDIYVVANIPYYITSPIISKLIELEEKPKKIVLLVQKEVAERIVADASTRDYNAFTLFISYAYEAKLLFFVDRTNFVPSPNVDSAVIQLTRKEKIEVQDKDFFLRFARNAFQNKRKTLKNNLKDYDWEKVKEILERLGYSENVRAEEIKKRDFYTLVNQYKG